MNAIYDICKKENLLDEYLKSLESEINPEIMQEVKKYILSFISEEKDNIINYVKEVNIRRKNNYLNLTNMEYKFIGLCSADELEKGNITPKIIINLYLNDGSHQLIESSFASFKNL